jgi:hypothetical protein
MTLTAAQQQALAAVTDAQQQLDAAKRVYANADPQGSLTSTLTQAKADLESSYTRPKREEASKAYSECTEAGNALVALQNVAEPSNLYTQTLQEKADKLANEQSQLTQKIRTQRRSFLDSFPQTGTGGAYGLAHDSDEFAMFILFIGFTAAYIAIFANAVPPSNYKLPIGIVGFVFAWVAINRAILYLG